MLLKLASHLLSGNESSVGKTKDGIPLEVIHPGEALVLTPWREVLSGS